MYVLVCFLSVSKCVCMYLRASVVFVVRKRECVWHKCMSVQV